MNINDLDKIKTPEKWLNTALEPKKIRSNRTQGQKSTTRFRSMRTAAAVLAAVLVFSACISAAASTSDRFSDFLAGIFGSEKVSSVTDSYSNTADIKSDKNGIITLEEDTMIVGEKESFVVKYHTDGDNETVDDVYTVNGNGLNRMAPKTFSGYCLDTKISFEYVVSGGEIYAFNKSNSVSEVFPYMNNGTAYAAVSESDEKSCIVSINLKTDTVTKISGDNMTCNFVMSPGGNYLLCNHRADGYWSLFDIANQKETKISTSVLDGYLHTDEIMFTDDTHILALGWIEEKEEFKTYFIDLLTQKVQEIYDFDGDEINMRWIYNTAEKSDNALKITDVTDGSSFTVPSAGDCRLLTAGNDYALFGSSEENDGLYYIVNLKSQQYIQIEVPDELKSDLQIYLVEKQQKLLISNGQKIYLADISK